MAKKVEQVLKDGEKIEDLLHGKLRIIQSDKGYRYSVDPLLLIDFVDIDPTDVAADLGSGSGVMPLILVARKNVKHVTGIEIQPDMVSRAQRSVEINELGDRIKIVESDIRELSAHFEPGAFDVVVSNPPYIPVESGRINPTDEKAIARHEIKAELADVVRAAKFLAKPGKGRVYMIYPAARTVDLIDALRKEGLEPKEIRFIHSNENSAARLVLVKAVRDAGVEVKICKPLYIYNLEGVYNDEAHRILGDDDEQTVRSFKKEGRGFS